MANQYLPLCQLSLSFSPHLASCKISPTSKDDIHQPTFTLNLALSYTKTNSANPIAALELCYATWTECAHMEMFEIRESKFQNSSIAQSCITRPSHTHTAALGIQILQLCRFPPSLTAPSLVAEGNCIAVISVLHSSTHNQLPSFTTRKLLLELQVGV